MKHKQWTLKIRHLLCDIVSISTQKYSLLKTKISRGRIAAAIKVTKDCLFKQYSENKIIYTGKLNFKRVFHSKIKRVVVPKQGGTLFCITKRKKHLKENIKPHFILRILIQMRLSLLSLFSIKNSHNFVPLNFINETIIRDAVCAR